MHKTAIDYMLERKYHSNEKAVVVLSGGQDSATCLALADHRHNEVFAISFDYGQKHRVELSCAEELAAEYGIPWHAIDLKFLGRMVTSALTGALEGDTTQEHPRLKNLPASFVPARNALFLTIAHGYAQEVGARYIYTGVCQTDYSGYPDCRSEFVGALESTLNIGYESSIGIETPLMTFNKAQTFEIAHRLGALEHIIERTHTCYNGDHTTLNDWGYGCAKCPSCDLRAKGWEQFITKFPGVYDASAHG